MVILLQEHSKKNDKKKSMIEKYNSSSYFYDKRYRAIQEKKYEIVLNKYILNGNSILDVGCGTGLLFEYIINLRSEQKVTRYKYVAVDISWNMLSEFKSKLASPMDNINVVLILADIENLPFRDNSFCSLFSITAFQNLSHIYEGIEESLRVCKKNADFKCSILKKKKKLKVLLSFLKQKMKDLEVMSKEDMEDIIIQGKLLKV